MKTISEQDNDYFKYIRTSIVKHGLLQMEMNRINPIEFLHRFDRNKRINVRCDVIGGVEETIDLEQYIENYEMTTFDDSIFNNNFGFQPFSIWLETTLDNKTFVGRTHELDIDMHALFLSRKVFDYLMGFKDKL